LNNLKRSQQNKLRNTVKHETKRVRAPSVGRKRKQPSQPPCLPYDQAYYQAYDSIVKKRDEELNAKHRLPMVEGKRFRVFFKPAAVGSIKPSDQRVLGDEFNQKDLAPIYLEV